MFRLTLRKWTPTFSQQQLRHADVIVTDELPEPYRLADPMTWLPSPASVVCLHSRADQRVPYAYSERYVAAALAAGGRARLVETFGDHFTLIDPATQDWAVAVAALPELLAG